MPTSFKLRGCTVLLVLTGLLSLQCGVLTAQTSSPAATSAAPSRAIDYRLKPGDEISLSFEQVAQYLNKTGTIDSHGNFPLNWLDPIALAGLTVKEAQEKVQRAYLEGDMLRNPKVTIVVETYTRTTVSIPSNVTNPGQVTLDPTKINTLVDVILRAGGFAELANGNQVRVVRVQPDGSTVTLGPFRVEDMIKGTAPIESAPQMQPNDIVDIRTRLF